MTASLGLFLFVLAALGFFFGPAGAAAAIVQDQHGLGREAHLANMSSNGQSIARAPSGGGINAPKAFLPNRYTVRDKKGSESSRDASYILSSLFAGVGSGALASVVCAPLDLIRTRMQVWGELHMGQHVPMLTIISDTIKKEGWKGCFRGLGATLATVPLFWGLYFPLYDELKRKWIASENGHTHPSLIHCGSAIGAGCLADVICNPMFVVRTRMQTEALHHLTNGSVAAYKPHGIFQTASLLYKEGGVRIFWRGMTASIMGLSHVAIQFPVYEFLKKEARARSKTGHETPLDLFISSGLSKACASLITYPHEVIRSRMMDVRSVDGAVTLLDTSRRIFAKEGLRGFYTGLHVSLLRVVPNCVITFMTYELLLRFAKAQIEARKTTDN